MSITVTYKSRFRQIGQEAEEELSKIVRKTAFNVESGAKQNAPVDTGFLRASVFTVTDRTSGFGGARTAAIMKAGASAAKTARKRYKTSSKDVRQAAAISAKEEAERGSVSSFIETIHAPGRLEALVAVGAEYGVYVEYGTTRAPAQPYLTPAVESVRSDFERECAKALAGNP